MVDNKPFFVRGGELGNSTASNLDNLNQYWPKFKKLNMNTVLAPVYWDLIEPKEGQFDFTLVRGLIKQAEENDFKLVLLWFGSWKNSMSSYCPEWIKLDYERFPRARDRNGRAYEILSPFAENNFRADAKAFSQLMKYIKRHDSKQTVIMVQPENEIGMVESAREFSDLANRAYGKPVPQALVSYLKENKDTLTPEVLQTWRAGGFKTTGSWKQIFGNSAQAQEIFMAWYFAYYTEQVAKAGKAEYPLPMFVNAALIRPGYQPGQYVSAGPLPHLIDIWRAAAPSIDFIAPDIYFPNFVEWTERYTRSNNPLFIPEALRNVNASINVLYALGEHNTLGFSPFGIESIHGLAERSLSASYGLIQQLEPILFAESGAPKRRGFVKLSDQQKAPQQVRLSGYQINVQFERAAPPDLADGVINESGDVSNGDLYPAGGLVIQLSQDEFLFAGTGITITFDSTRPQEQVGILSAESGRYERGKWKNRIWNNGDQTHQGRHVRLVPGEFDIQRVKLYRYR